MNKIINLQEEVNAIELTIIKENTVMFLKESDEENKEGIKEKALKAFNKFKEQLAKIKNRLTTFGNANTLIIRMTRMNKNLNSKYSSSILDSDAKVVCFVPDNVNSLLKDIYGGYQMASKMFNNPDDCTPEIIKKYRVYIHKLLSDMNKGSYQKISAGEANNYNQIATRVVEMYGAYTELSSKVYSKSEGMVNKLKGIAHSKALYVAMASISSIFTNIVMVFNLLVGLIKTAMKFIRNNANVIKQKIEAAVRAKKVDKNKADNDIKQLMDGIKFTVE